MIAKDRAVLKTYLRRAANSMELRDWTFEVKWETADENTAAHVATTYGQHQATVSFCDDFRDMDPEFQRYVVIHELTHIPSCGILWHIIKTLPDLLGSAAFSVWEATYRQLDEDATDTLARALAPNFPLIPWPK